MPNSSKFAFTGKEMEGFSVSKFAIELEKVEDEKKAAEMVSKKLVDAKNTLSKEWKKEKKNLEEIGKLLENSKWLLTRMNFMSGGKTSENDLLVAREILEIGARYSVAAKDMKGFDCYMDLLKGYYFDMKQCFKSESPSMYELLGLNLLRLLSGNLISDFHTQLELFVHQDVKKVLENPFIAKVVKIEQNLTEGRYHQLYKEKLTAPTEAYRYFVGLLLETIKNGIADCLQMAYEHLEEEDAAELLNIGEDSKEDIKEFAAKRNWKTDEKGRYCFDCVKNPYAINEKDKHDWIEQSLSYAKELEKIV